jgi:hypothetical protein
MNAEYTYRLIASDPGVYCLVYRDGEVAARKYFCGFRPFKKARKWGKRLVADQEKHNDLGFDRQEKTDER